MPGSGRTGRARTTSRSRTSSMRRTRKERTSVVSWRSLERKPSPTGTGRCSSSRTGSKEFIRQGPEEDRSIEDTLEIGWRLLATVDEAWLTKIDRKTLDKYHPKYRGAAKV